MRILFCNFHTGYAGGHNTYILSLVEGLAQKNHTISVACPASSQLYLSLDPTVARFAIDYHRILKKWWRNFKQLYLFKQWIAQNHFDIIHLNGSACHRVILFVYPFLKHKPKLIFTKHHALSLKSGAKLRLRYFVDAIIAVSKYNQQQLLQAGISKTIKLIPHGVDTDYYQPCSSAIKQLLRQQYDINHDDLVFVSNAGTAQCKNWVHLIAAIDALSPQLKKKIKVIIAGHHPPELEITENVKKFDLATQVIFPGLVPDVRPIINLGDIGFVLSNASETVSFACREMLAMGLPVIVSNFSGLPENVTAEHDGWIVPVNNIPSLTDLLITILTRLTPNDLKQMSQHARNKAIKQFDKKYFIDATEQAYADILRIKE
ncbi:glycosyltransferase family 4 protein [Rickettsiella endosymbiont of Rhagonycha lignosa]|uniref:glycosyltransferase family 4 protein n=1 Tax=Rickettsiella endosymbiont of Rhagonycha lignosa TaxID=3077937 RepID=UPI00313EF470